jgi:acyl-CoA synthetase
MVDSLRVRRYRKLGLYSDEKVGELLDRAAKTWPLREAVIFGERRLTFAELASWAASTAQALSHLGFKSGDRLLWQLPNSVECVVLHFAAWRIGMVSVPVVPLYRDHEMRYILDEVRPAVVAFADDVADRLQAVQRSELMRSVGVDPRLHITIGSEGADWAGLRQPRRSCRLVDDMPPADAEECCLILYTSGTSSNPKGVKHNSRSLIAEAVSWRRRWGLGSSDVFLMGAPVTHIAGLITTLLLPVITGGKAILLPKWNPDAAVQIAEQERATFSCGAAVFLQDMVDRYESGRAPEHRLSMFMCGGAAVAPTLIERADAIGVKAFRCWGMTEAPTTTLASPSDPLELRANRDGQVSPGVEIEAVDHKRLPLPTGAVGELRLRAPEQMIGYIDPQSEAAQTDSEGWFYSGDVGFVDGAGWVTMTGRVKDIVNRGGEKFSSQDIEHALANHPAVSSAIVIGVPDERLGEAVAAFIVLRPGREWPGRVQLHSHLDKQRLAPAKFPKYFRVISDPPRTMSGKVQKHELLRRWTESLARAPELR